MKAIVKNIVECEVPSEKLVKFFSLLTDDDNYFEDAFLYDFERAKLMFSE